MLSILSVIPVIGPIIQGVVDLFAKKMDVDLQKQVDANKTALGKQQDISKTDLGVIQTRALVAIAFKDDLGVRLIRDLVMFPVSVWTGFYFFYLTFKNNLPPSWEVGLPPDNMQYIPYAMIAFLFVTAYRGK